MGVWNETCLLSNLPIVVDEPTNVVFLVQRKTWGHLYEEAWAPYSLPMLGKYDEYGCVKGIVLDWKAQVFLERLKSSDHVVMADLRKGNRDSLEDELLLVQSAAYDEGVLVRDGLLGFALIREDVRKTVLGLDLGPYLPTIEQTMARVRSDREVVHSLAGLMTNQDTVHKVAGKLADLFTAMAETDAELREVAEFYYLRTAMTMLRRRWIVQQGGHQETKWAVHGAFAEAVGAIARKNEGTGT